MASIPAACSQWPRPGSPPRWPPARGGTPRPAACRASALMRRLASLETSTTSRSPASSLARLAVVARIRLSLEAADRASGRSSREARLTSTQMRPPPAARPRPTGCPAGGGAPGCGWPAWPSPGVVGPGLELVQLLDHGQRDGDVVLLEATRGLRVGDEHVGVEHIGRAITPKRYPDQEGLAMTSYLELDSAMRVQTAPDYGDGGGPGPFLLRRPALGDQAVAGSWSRRGGGQRQSSDDAREGPRSHRGPSLFGPV
jgi:hypothetical protein